MAVKSSIEWTESTWNPVTGCSKISLGCKNCYAERMARRLQAMHNVNYKDGFKLTLQSSNIELPLRWKQPQLIFVNSMSDLFHKQVPLKFILRIFTVMREANWHTFQILTKRSDRLLALDSKIIWPPNVWMGVSVENSDYKFRIDDLRQTRAMNKFLSLEPLLGPLPDLNFEGIDWIITGGESGPGARPLKEEWVIDIRNQCRKNDIPFFFKQWGGVNKKKAGRILDGRTWDEIPSLAFA
jgi:protein gp37